MWIILQCVWACRLQSRVDELRAEEMRLTERIVMLKREEMSIGQDDTRFEAIRKKELELSEVRN